MAISVVVVGGAGGIGKIQHPAPSPPQILVNVVVERPPRPFRRLNNDPPPQVHIYACVVLCCYSQSRVHEIDLFSH